MRAKFAVKSGTFFDGRENKADVMAKIAHMVTALSVSLNFQYLSRRIPFKKEPATPKSINVPPKIELSIDSQPYGDVKDVIIAPNEVYIPYRHVKQILSRIKLQFVAIALISFLNIMGFSFLEADFL